MVKDSYNFKKTKRAVLLENFGNATTDNSLYVSVYDGSYALSGKETGNTFAVDDNRGVVSLDSNSINLKWISDDTLLIIYNQKLRTFSQEKSVNNVIILYQPSE